MTRAPEPTRRPRLLGALLAGGRSHRYGTDKAYVTLGGATLAARSRDLLSPLTEKVIVFSWDSRLGGILDLEVRSDDEPGLGPVGGLATALRVTEGEGADGVLVLGCDTPLVPPGILAELVALWDGARVCLPESVGPLGVEPLCGVYPVAIRSAVEAASQMPDRSMASLVRGLDVLRLPLERVARYGDPEASFLNLNRPEDLERAEAVLRRRGHEPDQSRNAPTADVGPDRPGPVGEEVGDPREPPVRNGEGIPDGT